MTERMSLRSWGSTEKWENEVSAKHSTALSCADGWWVWRILLPQWKEVAEVGQSFPSCLSLI